MLKGISLLELILGTAGILAARLGDGDGTPTKPRGLQLGTKDQLFLKQFKCLDTQEILFLIR